MGARRREPRIERSVAKAGVLPVGTAMYCGRLAVIGGIGGGGRFEVELEDSGSKRKLQHAYAVRVLAIAD